MEIKLLTEVQERSVLNKIIACYSATDNGAARIVFLVSNQDLTECGLILDSNKKYVVKVALGLAGINQNHIEAETYRRFGEKVPLAEIAYIGHYVEIMERVIPCEDLRAYATLTEEDFVCRAVENCDISVDEAYAAYKVIQQLASINGDTNDNGQLGYNAKGEWVAFDYGYDAESDKDLCSNLYNYLDIGDSQVIDDYLFSLIDIIDKEEDALIQLENEICCALDRSYNNEDYDD